jgi:hypothetical protein
MEFVNAGEVRYSSHIAGVEAATRKDREAGSGLLDELAECLRGVGNARSTSRGEKTGRARERNVFEGFGKVVGVVEGAVESEGKRSCQSDEFAGARHVHGTVWVQDPCDDSVHIFIPKGGDCRLHLHEFVVVVDEIARARTNQHVNWDAHGGSHSADEFNAGSKSANLERIAEFEAMRAGTFGGNGAIERRHGDFEKEFLGHLGLNEKCLGLSLAQTESSGGKGCVSPLFAALC